jgi:hypothetical protein
MIESIALYRAVTEAELADILGNGNKLRDSPHLSGEKGFFYDLKSATQFADEAEKAFGEKHFVIRAVAEVSALEGSREHSAAGEGRGVYLQAGKLHLLSQVHVVEETL